MSEFISTCPKCNHQIMGDTAYVGMRVACPVCLQEITMPAPSQLPAQSPQPQTHAGTPPSPDAALQKRNTLMLAIIIGPTILVLAMMGAIFIFHKNPQAAPPTHSLAAVSQPIVHAQSADSPNHDPNSFILETPTYIIKITGSRTKNALNSPGAIYDGVSKNLGRRIVINGSETYSTSSDGSPSHFLGWTFINSSTIYFVSAAGELKVTQGASVLVSERGQWKQKPKTR
jgi:hypothetical protein